MCMLCSDNKAETRYIDLYVIGSEGLRVCHKCEMKLVEFCHSLQRENLNINKEDYKKNHPERFGKPIIYTVDELENIQRRNKK
jgi:hypothetical protein